MAQSGSTSALALASALHSNETLGGLLQRVRASQALLALAAEVLPAGLRDAVRSGPLDDEGWVLLVANAAAAAKLRQVLPAVEALLRQHGHRMAVKVKVLPRQA
ncbi:hypothetical protein [Rubrivivax rivuli]|uniref:DUF721 domain-containing protein n=1 Tax=Rubrivivax rivuli TaxID=1862385 RepID=A0A437RBX4_9BURK|nr:hypothetical protein [Rubrivivax rivuli]RVU44291.1 hypothetical protein EOE66_16550 [Rubrivivax rivuli]